MLLEYAGSVCFVNLEPGVSSQGDRVTRRHVARTCTVEQRFKRCTPRMFAKTRARLTLETVSVTTGDHCRRLPRCQCQSICLARAVHLLVVAAPPRGLTTASQGRTAPPTEPRLASPCLPSAFCLLPLAPVASPRLASLARLLASSPRFALPRR